MRQLWSVVNIYSGQKTADLEREYKNIVSDVGLGLSSSLYERTKCTRHQPPPVPIPRRYRKRKRRRELLPEQYTDGRRGQSLHYRGSSLICIGVRIESGIGWTGILICDTEIEFFTCAYQFFFSSMHST